MFILGVAIITVAILSWLAMLATTIWGLIVKHDFAEGMAGLLLVIFFFAFLIAILGAKMVGIP